jgi:hypothetical protein
MVLAGMQHFSGGSGAVEADAQHLTGPVHQQRGVMRAICAWDHGLRTARTLGSGLGSSSVTGALSSRRTAPVLPVRALAEPDGVLAHALQARLSATRSAAAAMQSRRGLRAADILAIILR